MTWTKLSDDFTDRPAMLRVSSRSARLLHVEALVYCNRHLTDGEITRAALPRITDAEDLEADVDELERAGLWERLDLDRWHVDWSDQLDGAVVRKRREQTADRQRAFRERRGSRNASRNALRDASVTMPRPGPKRPGRETCPNGAPVTADGSCCPEHDASRREASA